MRYYEPFEIEPDAPLTCPYCGHSGRPDVELFAELTELECASCGKRIGVRLHASHDQVREAAGVGNPHARRCLELLTRQENRWARAQALELKRGSRLPDLRDKEIVIVWDLVEDDGEHYTVLRHGDLELWREIAFWEGWERFKEVAILLRRRYGKRLRGLEPTDSAAVWVFGDRLSTVEAFDRMKARLAAGRKPFGR